MAILNVNVFPRSTIRLLLTTERKIIFHKKKKPFEKFLFEINSKERFNKL